MCAKSVRKCLKVRFKGVEKVQKPRQVPAGYFGPGPKGNVIHPVKSMCTIAIQIVALPKASHHFALPCFSGGKEKKKPLCFGFSPRGGDSPWGKDVGGATPLSREPVDFPYRYPAKKRSFGKAASFVKERFLAKQRYGV